MDHNAKQNLLRPELYFLIQKFLAESPLQETYKVLSKELEDKMILPIRLDWEGNSHERSFDDLERLYPHVGSDHILEICKRIGPILDKEIPPCVRGVTSLLGSGRQSLLRNANCMNIRKVQLYHATRRHGMPVCDPYLINISHNIVNILIGREMSGPIPRVIGMPPSRYTHLQLQRQTLGHLSAVYCLLFDHTGRFIVTAKIAFTDYRNLIDLSNPFEIPELQFNKNYTLNQQLVLGLIDELEEFAEMPIRSNRIPFHLQGADDLLVKLWSAISGRLLASFRGASAEITDIDINLENTLLAAGSIDRILRVWDLQTGAPVAVLTCHTGMITSVHFCPSARWDIRYLISTSSDGSVAFWTYSHDSREKAQFVSRPIIYQEKMRPGQAQMICSSFSPGGNFLAAGSADHHVRVYLMRGDEGPIRVLETEVHTDRVDSIAWAHRGLRFISGSKDGTAFIWHFERQQWKSQKLCMTTKIPGTISKEDEETKLKVFVTMVAWDYSDSFIITAVSDNSLKVWNSSSGELQRVLTGHTDGIYVLESHPKDPNVVLSTGHDGQLFIWDILRGKHVANFTNSLDNGQGCAAVFDAKWSPEGTMFAASDSHGHIMIFGFGNGNPQLKLLPKELFFHTDYRPLVRDNEHLVLDEQTQIPPHLMPPPFLVDIDGNPFPPMLQRLVPGREQCTSEQLVPNIVIGTGGRQEVIEGLPIDGVNPRSDLDRLIAALAQRRYGPEENDANDAATSPRSGGRNLHNRRVGDVVEGVRQSTGDWQGDQNIIWSKNVLVQPLNRFELESERQLVETISLLEMSEYQKENKRRPLMINTATSSTKLNEKDRRRRRNGAPATRANNSHEEEENEENNSSTNNSGDETSAKEDMLSLSDSSSDDDESSGYSDWVADQGVNLEPPKRSKRRPAQRKIIYNDQHEAEDEEQPSTSASAANTSATSPKTKTKRITMPKILKVNGEVPEIYKALEWLSETVPRKAPYYPQMGDEVVYFIQGHQMYVNAVRLKKVYNVNNKDLPWTKHKLQDHEFVKIVGIKYEIRPPRLCCIKLALLDSEHRLTDNVFTIKYHDMADVLDFFVLKQTYETAIMRNWDVGDRFRCMIDDGWWIGKIVSKSDLTEEYQDSLFMCYEIQWDNGEFERMSPWDLEPIRDDRLPENIGAAVPVTPDEIQSILYQPSTEEWPRGDREAACRLIISGLDKVMELAIAEPFLAPVDFNAYPSYAYIVEYPLDLSTIKARFDNHFYRRITSAQFDVRYLATNAEKFNQPHSVIVKSARIITDLCLRIIKQSHEEIDVPALYHQMIDTYESSCSDEDEDVDVVEAGPSTSAAPNPSNRRALKTRNLRNFADWRVEAKKLLDDMWRSEDSAPFRIPVDRIKHPDYYQMVDTPMDMATVREDLFGGNYETPNDFAKDMRLIFTNSKNYNTNKRSRIHSMTIRLSSNFEEHIRKIINLWKRTKNIGSTIRKSGRKVKPSTSTNNPYEESDSDNSEKENQETTRKQQTRENVKINNNKKKIESNSSSDEDEVLAVHAPPDVVNNGNTTTHSSCSNYSADTKPSRAQNARTKPLVASDDEKSSSSDSDYKPLCNYVEAAATTSVNKRKILKLVSSSSNDDDSSDDLKKSLRPRSVKKKRKRFSDSSDSDNIPLGQINRDNSDDGDEDDYSDDSDKRIVTISSRGRVRKLTEKARAIFKK